VIRLALFDIDGTLIRTKGAGVEAFWRTMASEFGVRNPAPEVHFDGRTDTSLVRDLLERAGVSLTEEHFGRFFDRYVFWLDRLLHERATVGSCPAVRPFLAELQQLAEPPLVGLLTGNIRLGAEIKLRYYDLWDPFTMGAFGDDHEDRNQLAAIAKEQGSRIVGRPLKGEEVLVIGDTPLDVACGQAIGARVLAVATGGATAEELRACDPDWVLPDLEGAAATEFC